MVDYSGKLLKICLAACLGMAASACNESVDITDSGTTELCNHNGTKDGDEACDGTDFGGKTCADYEGAGATGSLTCNECKIDSSNCAAAVQDVKCGNNIKDGSDECDGTDFGGKTCADYEGEGATGSLTCNECKIDSSNCAAAVQDVKCGNNIKDGSDECDGTDFGDATCTSVLGETATGSLSCSEDCKIVSTGCTKPVATCNNDNIKDEGEDCDGTDFGTKTCADYKGEGATGSLVCDNCTIVSTNCVSGSTANPGCGDGTVGDGEDCDGALMGTATCASVMGNPNATGTLACDASTCKFDITGCIIDPCYTVVCDEGTCEKGVCVTDAMKALKNGDACDEDTIDFCDGDVAVYCTEAGIIRNDCTGNGGCALINASEALSEPYFAPYCRGTAGFCKEAGDKISYCATKSAGTIESYYYCTEAVDGSIIPVDMADIGIYSKCTGGCNADNTQCKTPEKLWCDYDEKCSNSNTVMTCDDYSIYRDELDIEENTKTCGSGEVCAVVNGSTNCYKTCTEESFTKTCKKGSAPNFGILTTSGCVKGDDGNLYSINKSTNCYAGCNDTLDDCVKLSDKQETPCEGIGVTSCDPEHNDVWLRCTLGRWGATHCASGTVCGDLGPANGGAQCYTPCDTKDVGKATSICTRDIDPYYGAFARQVDSKCTKIGDLYVERHNEIECEYSLCTSDGTQCSPNGYALCPADTELMSGETCGSYCSKQSATAQAIVNAEGHAFCSEPCDTEGESERVFCVNNRKHTQTIACRAIEGGKYALIKSDSFEQCLDACETGSNPTECNAQGTFTEGYMACDSYCRVGSSSCADVCKARNADNLCAMTPAHTVECGLACNSGDADIYVCASGSLGKKIAYKAVCTKLLDNTYMYISENTGTTCSGECTDGVGCVE